MSETSSPSQITIFQEHAGSIEHLSPLKASLHFAQIARIAYLQPGNVDGYLGRIGLNQEHFIDRDGAQAYILGSETDLVVAYRGTEPNDWNDVKADVNALTVLAETVGRVHRGFKREVDDLWPRIEKVVHSDRRAVWFTGHSLGGAMATISAGRCHLSPIPVEPRHTYTFGAPRVGTKRYVNHAKVRVTRWVNNNDIVPRVPPTWLGYRHTGRHMYLDSQGNLRRLTRRQRTQDRWRGFREGIKQGSIDPLADHAMARYVEYIYQAVRSQDG